MLRCTETNTLTLQCDRPMQHHGKGNRVAMVTGTASNRDNQPQVSVLSEVHREGKNLMQLQACLNGPVHPLYNII